MAEGRSATMLFQLQKRGFNVTGSKPDDGGYDDDDEYGGTDSGGYITLRLSIPTPPKLAQLSRALARYLAKLFVNRLFPSSIATFVTVQLGVVLTTVFAESDSWLRSGWLAELLWRIDLLFNPLQRLMSIQARVAVLAATASLLGFLLIVAVERFLLRVLLSFGPSFVLLFRQQRVLERVHGQKPSWAALQVVALWKWALDYFLFLGGGTAVGMNLASATQLCLPAQPVPSLQQTVRRVLESVEPVLVATGGGGEEYAHVRELAHAFVHSRDAVKLNLYLYVRSIVCGNYCAPWFERYVYLSHRSSLQANSNYYVMDCGTACTPVRDQVFRAANLCHHLCAFSAKTPMLPTTLIHHGTVPLCMKQYDRLFATCRVPGREVDSLKTRPKSQHLVVVRKGRYYKLDVTRGGDTPFLSPAEFAHQLRLICEHAAIESRSSSPAGSRHSSPTHGGNGNSNGGGSIRDSSSDVAALTSLPRTHWAELRDAHFSDGVNRKSLVAVENALFVVHLVDHHQASSSANSLLDRARYLFHGQGSGIWFDKSFNLIVFDNGLAGLNCEISFADAPCVAHMWETALLGELVDFENSCDASALAGESLRGAPLPMPTPLAFTISSELAREIKDAKLASLARQADSQMDILQCQWLGSEQIQHAMRLSPDAFIQLALVYATYVDFGNRPSLAYESAQLRMFREGRTEAVRSFTPQAKLFVEHMTSGDGGSTATARQLCREACAAHSKLALEACIGRGVDNHLFALNVAAKRLKIRSPFLDYMHNKLTWSISSSQQPQAQTKMRDLLANEDRRAKFVSTGGGYAPISSNGYGVAYTLTKNEVFFHITGEKSKHTNCRRFKQTLERVLRQMQALMVLDKDKEEEVASG